MSGRITHLGSLEVTMHSYPTLFVCLLASAALPAAGLAGQDVERYEVAGDRVAIFNLAGSATVEAGSGTAVVVEVHRRGPDADRLDIQRGPVGGAQTLRVVYPDGNVVFATEGWSGHTEIRVNRDGTFGSGSDGADRARRVRIASDGDGTRAHADLRILVPRGRKVDVYLAVGPLSASGVTADLRLDGGSGRVTTARTAGSLVVDVGSGAVQVRNHEGDGNIDTGSGSVSLAGIRGGDLIVDTGSGEVTLTDVRADDLRVDTGSGGVRGSGITAQVINVDTGSGTVDLTLQTAPRECIIDTGSGDVTVAAPEGLDAAVELETSSGAITVDFAMQIRQRERDEVRGTIGSGSGTLRIDTSSGDITLRKQ